MMRAFFFNTWPCNFCENSSPPIMVVIGGVLAILLLGIIEDWRQGFMLPGYSQDVNNSYRL